MLPSKLALYVLAGLLFAATALAYSGQVITNTVLDTNASLLADLEAPPPAHIPHDVEITEAVASSDGHVLMLIDRTFVHELTDVCEPSTARPIRGEILHRWSSDELMTAAESPPERSGQRLSG